MPKTPESELRYKQNLYIQNKAAGICVDCSTNPAKPSRVRCEHCLERRREREHHKIAQGLCRRCGNHIKDGKTTCLECCARDAQNARSRRKRRRNAGMCHRCGINLVTPPYSMCEPCRSKNRIREHNRRFGNGNRKTTIELDGGKCRLCGSIKRFRVHHIDGNPSNQELDNLITLCLPCHYQVHKVATYCTDLTLFNELVLQLA